MISQFHRIDSVICNHSTEGETLSYSRISKVAYKSHLQSDPLFFTEMDSSIPVILLGSSQSVHILYFFRVFFSLQNNPKKLDSSYKMDLDLWDCLRRVKLVL